ncbi:MAG TPA: methyltransferase domain-containing protein [Terriglobales bacterium]|jgi:trans-aconitate methyltransferase|nr:methyltransferase domain-containing protein [Terriglobales bacterium]
MAQSPQSNREWNSSEYHRLSQPQVSWGKKVLSRLQLRGDEFVLDAGAGTGRLTADLLQALPRGRVVALDVSQNMSRTAREYLRPQFGGRVQMVTADLLNLPFRAAFDGIVSTAAFHWVLDHDRLFRGLLETLRPGGWLHAQCGGGENLARLGIRMADLAASAKYSPFLRDFPSPWLYQNAEDAAESLRRAGFVDVKTSLEAAPTLFDDRSHYSQFVKAVIVRTHLERLPGEKLREQYVSDLADQAEKDDPPFLLDYWRLNLSARKPQ